MQENDIEILEVGELKDTPQRKETPKKKKRKLKNPWKKKKEKKNKKIRISTIVFLVLDIGALLCLFLAYGPFSYLRNLYITSSMETMTHKYLARTIYSDKMIANTLSKNKVIEGTESTNAGDITFTEIKETDTYESIYEEQILKKDEGNDLYKIIEVEGNGYKGHMVVIYDPSRIELVQSSRIRYGGQQLDTMAKENNALAAINASGFTITSGALNPVGTVIMDGKLISDSGETGYGGGIVGFNKDHVLVLSRKSAQEALNEGIIDAMDFGPFLIVNGVPATFRGNGGYGLASRTAIAQRKDGIVLFVVIDGRRPGHSLGIDMVDLTNLLLKYKAYNASNLDGGGSSTLYADGSIISIAGGYGYSGDRYLPNAWMLK